MSARIALALLLMALAFWAGMRWERGENALDSNAELRRLIGEYARINADYAGKAETLYARHEAAAAHLSDVANALELDHERNRLQSEAQRTALATLLEQRPDLRGRAGADVLRHWRESNAGRSLDDAADAPATDSAAPVTTSEPAATVPGTAAACGRPLGDAAGQPRFGDGPLSRLPFPACPVDRSGARVAGHGLALVLPSRGVRH